MKRKIAVITTSRADYGHLYWVLRELSARDAITFQLIVLGAHPSPEYGLTGREIERGGFPITEQIECLLSSDTDVGMAKTIGLATLSLADALGRLRPDILLLIADRYEMLAPASVALALRIPVAHIEGGELSTGAIDDAVRHALTKMSHLHFTPTAQARRRVLSLGEEPWRVHQTGAPSLDHLRRRKLFTAEELEQALGISLHVAPVLIAYHPVTLARDTTREADAVFTALGRLAEDLPRPFFFCFPNADAGSHDIMRRAREFCQAHSAARLFVNLNHLQYWSLLNCAAVLVGNSSSGIMETPSLRKPTVNIGLRQEGRERAANIIDAAPDAERIADAVHAALRPAFAASLAGLANPYGDGHAAERIAEVLATVELGERLRHKAGF